MLRLKLVCAVAVISAQSTVALAATLQPTAGNVLVNRGNGFKSAGVGQSQVQPGDMVMASGGGSAQIIYNDGCKVGVEPGSVVTVAGATNARDAKGGLQELSPCADGQAGSGPSDPGASGSAASGAGAGSAAISPYAIAAGAVVVGVGVAVLSKKSSASP